MTNQPATSENSPDQTVGDHSESTLPPDPRPTARQQISAYSQGSVANMLRSVLVIGAIMALFLVMAPRLQPDHSGVEPIETARQLQQSTGLPVSVPQDLPDGWVATRAEYRRGADSLMTWHVLYETPDGDAVALNQALDATPVWVAQMVNQTEQVGQQELAGLTWEHYAREGATPQRSFVDRGESGELSTVVTGDASWDDLETFVAALTPADAT